MLTGKQDIAKQTYFFKDNGAMVTGWNKEGETGTIITEAELCRRAGSWTDLPGITASLRQELCRPVGLR